MYIVIPYLDHNGAKRFATVEAIPSRIKEMRERLRSGGFKLL
tara:strand:- start:265 stop:390 length:126 start_codon:yes stop_codon:yes gene_type:complete